MVRTPKDLNQRNEHPYMVCWLTPSVVLKVIKKVIASAHFWPYVDRRLVYTSLDTVDPESFVGNRFGSDQGNCWAIDEPITADAVSDLSDGFDSLYAIAYPIAQDFNEVSYEPLARGNFCAGARNTQPVIVTSMKSACRSARIEFYIPILTRFIGNPIAIEINGVGTT